MADEKISELAAKTTLGAADLLVIMDEAAAPDKTKHITWANLLKALNKIVDPTDQDSYVEVGEDWVKMVIAAVEAFNLNVNGILTLDKQCRARAYQNTAQEIPDQTSTHVLLDAESFDEQGEMDVGVFPGTADATSANQLKNTNAFAAAESTYLGRTVWNTTDNTYAAVTGKTDDSTLDLDDDIMVDTESYKLYFSRYTATVAGTYLVVGIVTHTDISDLKACYAQIYKNGAAYLSVNKLVSSVGMPHIGPMAVDVMELAVSDYITLVTWHDEGSLATLVAGADRTLLSIAKIG